MTMAFAVAVAMALAGASDEALPDLPNPAAVAEVASGQRTTASAAWWGFDETDATEFLQAAIDSGARAVLVPYMGRPWIVRPIRLRGSLELTFVPGVLVLAKEGEFKSGGDCLFSVSDASDIAVRGYGAALRMRKADYQSKEYEKAEWRMTLSFSGCSRVTVEGLRLESSGGDGIYIGATGRQPYCEDVTIRDVVCHDHHRQGISVISAVNLLIEHCTLSNTRGTAPQAGIDLEPNASEEKLVNCVIRDCVMEENSGAGILVYLKPLSKASEPVSILFDQCLVRGGRDSGIGVGAVKDDGPQGTIEFRDCTIESANRGGCYLYDKSPSSARVRFVRCKWNCEGQRGGSFKEAPILIDRRREEIATRVGGIDFVDCVLWDTRDRPAVGLGRKADVSVVSDVKGRLFVASPGAARLDFGPDPQNAALELMPLDGASPQ